MESEYDATVIMISSDGEKFELSKRAAMRSQLVKESISENSEDAIEFKVDKVKGTVLKKVVEYLEHYKDQEPKEIERPLQSQNFNECVDDWDYNFIDLDLDKIFEINLAANYLDIRPLLDLSGAKIASLIKGKTTQEVRKIFNIENEFTPEEEEQIIEENKWCMENL